MFRSVTYHTYKDEEKKHGNHLCEQFEKPSEDDCINLRQACFAKLDPEDGLIEPGVRVAGDDVIVGKTAPTTLGDGDRPLKRCHSLMNRSTECGIVDSVLLTTNHEGFRTAKVRIRSERVPEVGDKFSSEHGQKGTCGLLMAQEDMPFTIGTPGRGGIVPDVIINPHAFPRYAACRVASSRVVSRRVASSRVVSRRVASSASFPVSVPVAVCVYLWLCRVCVYVCVWLCAWCVRPLTVVCARARAAA